MWTFISISLSMENVYWIHSSTLLITWPFLGMHCKFFQFRSYMQGNQLWLKNLNVGARSCTRPCALVCYNAFAFVKLRLKMKEALQMLSQVARIHVQIHVKFRTVPLDCWVTDSFENLVKAMVPICRKKYTCTIFDCNLRTLKDLVECKKEPLICGSLVTRTGWNRMKFCFVSWYFLVSLWFTFEILNYSFPPYSLLS